MTIDHDRVSARARAMTYRLFADVFRHGPTGVTGGLIAATGEFKATLNGTDEEVLAVEHESIFGFNVYPYASAFMEPDGRLGGAVSGEVHAVCTTVGFSPVDDSVPVDHISTELEVLAWMTDPGVAVIDHTVNYNNAIANFLDQHVLAWIPAFAEAVRRQESPFYTRLVDFLVDLVLDHRQSLGESPPASSRPLPAAPPLLEEPSTGIRKIAVYLSTTVWSGMYISRKDLQQFARGMRIPHGFGSRADMIENIIRSAATYGELDRLLDELISMVQGWKEMWSAMEERSRPSSLWAAAWSGRLDDTSDILRQIRTEGERLSHDS